MEPIAQLAPYLSDLNVGDAVESFTRLADSLLDPSAGPPSLASSPAPSDPAYSSWSSSPFLSSASASASPSSLSASCSPCSSRGGPSSVTSSCDLQEQQFGCSLAGVPPTAATRKPRSPAAHEQQRRKNATAADRYRKRLKGRKCGLDQQMEREQERNQHLRRELEAKLTLYREFVALLARNTSPVDRDLASLGSRSLSAVLAGELADGSSQQHESYHHQSTQTNAKSRNNQRDSGEQQNTRRELQQHLIRFQTIASAS